MIRTKDGLVEIELRADCWKKRAEKAERSLQGAKTLVTQYRDELRDACDMNTSNEPTALGMMRERAEKAERELGQIKYKLEQYIARNRPQMEADKERIKELEADLASSRTV
jgi:ElaB/YqjD/DUF883 family membrane-anchored ribosome-binding protein